jgi:hypothetical protein
VTASACPVRLLDHLHRRLRRRHVGDDDVGAVLREPLREGLADAVGGTGDDGDFSLVRFGHAVPLANSE